MEGLQNEKHTDTIILALRILFKLIPLIINKKAIPALISITEAQVLFISEVVRDSVETSVNLAPLGIHFTILSVSILILYSTQNRIKNAGRHHYCEPTQHCPNPESVARFLTFKEELRTNNIPKSCRTTVSSHI